MIIDNVLLARGAGAPLKHCDVVLDDAGTVTALRPTTGTTDRYVIPPAVDLHLDNLAERRRPRAGVVLDLPAVVAALDAECAASGTGLVCVAARCEESPGKGIHAADAVALAEVVEVMAEDLACDWYVHARVEITDAVAIPALREVLEVSSRVRLVSFMEHSLAKSRFPSPEATEQYYAEDWGMTVEETRRILASKTIDDHKRRERRSQVAAIARQAGLPLASHDDSTAEAVIDAHRLGAAVSEFPLSPAASQQAGKLGMTRVLGAPNAVRGRSTSPGNLLVADAVPAGLVEALCTDYLPSALAQAPFSLAAQGVGEIGDLVDLVSLNPAQVIGAPFGTIKVGAPFTASVVLLRDGSVIGRELWRNGKRTFSRG